MCETVEQNNTKIMQLNLTSGYGLWATEQLMPVGNFGPHNLRGTFNQNIVGSINNVTTLTVTQT